MRRIAIIWRELRTTWGFHNNYPGRWEGDANFHADEQRRELSLRSPIQPAERAAGRSTEREEGAVSKKSTRTGLDKAAIPKIGRHCSVFCSQVQSWLTESGRRDYSFTKAGIKKEIPDHALQSQ